MTQLFLGGLLMACTCLVAQAPRAQQVWVVDNQGGAGSQFTEIQDAIDHANPNDVIVVRPSSLPYVPFGVSKPLRIVGGPGVTIRAGFAVSVSGIGSGQVVVLSDLYVDVISSEDPIPGLVISNNAGSVHCENVDIVDGPTQVLDSRQVSFDACDTYGVFVQRSDVLLTSSNGWGYWIPICGPPCPPYYALDVQQSRVTLAGGTWVGGDGLLGTWPALPAVYLSSNSRLLVTGDQQTVIQAGGVWQSAPAILTTGGEIVRDPDPQLIPFGTQPPIAGPAVVVEARVPYLRTAVENGTLIATLFTWSGAQAYLFASPFVPPIPMPAPLADLWVGQPVLLAAGPTAANGSRVDAFALPTLLPGAAVPLQSAVVWNGQVVLSNPAVPVLAH